MDQNDVAELSASSATNEVTASQGVVTSPPASPVPCPTCGSGAASMSLSYVYALGRVEWRFPNLGVRNEFAQAAGRVDTSGKTDQQVFHEVLSKRENRYLVRQMCSVFTIQGLETYLLLPHNPADFELLVGAIRPMPGPNDIDIVVGVRGSIAPPEMCNGLMVPIVAFDHIYSFDRDAHIKSIPRPKNVAAKEFQPAAEELFRQDHANNRQRRRDGRASGTELLGRALSWNLRQGGGRICPRFFTDGGGGTPFAFEQHPQHR